ncbi:MAG: NADH-quinone oxidoreductase subunit D [Planctomycetota bacterium]
MSLDILLDDLAAAFPFSVLETHNGRLGASALIDKESTLEILTWLGRHEKNSFEFLSDLSALDRFGQVGMDHRFEVVYQLVSWSRKERFALKVAVSEDDLEVPSVCSMFRLADWAEREVFDLFGIRFRGHPNLKRILTHQAFQGHALRKDFDIQQASPLEDVDDMIDEIGAWGENPEDLGFTELVPLNLGPAHPALRGVLRILVKIDGECINQAACEIGYLHRGVEKELERRGWAQAIPFTDRLNWASPWLNNLAWCEAVERLLDLKVPDRAETIRVMMAELSRISDHATCLAATFESLGLRAAYWRLQAITEGVTELNEAISGVRHNPSFLRIGGLSADLPDGFENSVAEFSKQLVGAIDGILDFVLSNPIFDRRTRGVGVVSAATALSYGWTGPCLRASGLNYDLRQFDAKSAWRHYRFKPACRKGGDVHARILVRFDEIVESLALIEQALYRLNPGEIMTSNKAVALPKKSDVSSSLEGMANHVLLLTEGMKVPKGEVYHAIEGANGELGFHLISDGGTRPRRARCRPPSFHNYAAFPSIVAGQPLSHAIPILASLNVVAGELDR